MVIVMESAQIGKKIAVLSLRPLQSEKHSMKRDEKMPSLLMISEHSLMRWILERCKCILRMHSHALLDF